MSQVLTYKYRLLPTKAQHAALSRILEDQRHLYNAALEERIDCYRKTGQGLAYIDQCKALTEWRHDDALAAAVPLNIQRWTLGRLDEAYKAFFRRMRTKKGKAGFPRYRGKGWWQSFGFAQFRGVHIEGSRLRWSGFPSGLRVHLHRALPIGDILACSFTRTSKGWHICLQMRVAAMSDRTPVASIGIDVGLTHLATLSTGETVPNVRPAKRAERELRRRQRALARCRQGSARHHKIRAKVTQLHRKTADTRSTYLHQVSASLVRRFDMIAVEKLNVKGLAGGMLAKSIHDASWSRLRQLLAYKAERAGARLIEVDPRYTSQACSGCGVIAKKELSERVHDCADCGTVLDRDHNAALNILRKGVVALGERNVTDCGERARGNVSRMSDTLPDHPNEPSPPA